METTRFPYELCYDKTKWGLFYEGYKEQSQQALSKRILKMENEQKKLKAAWKCTYERSSVVQGIFQNTEWDERRSAFINPPILNMKKPKKSSDAWCENKSEQLDIAKEVFKEYFQRSARELEEVKKYFSERQKELGLEQHSNHKIHANEKVTCPICSACVSRTNIARHKKLH